MRDSYKTIEKPAEGYIREKKSKFFSYILPVHSEEEAMEQIDACRKKYYDARHVCWAYMLGADREAFRFNDDGEPSGTAGRPIMGQINSYELTDVLIMVIRYFGGVLLGTSGLIKAYRAAAKDAIDNSKIVTKLLEDRIELYFEYPQLNDVMRILKQYEEVKWEQDFKESCKMILHVRKSLSDEIVPIFESVYGVKVLIDN